ncbi:hypothetical protein BS50DRAFT_507487 [Corynespora cassiicola Philippines]|uniref:Acid protease n=1 Tax=Corynespora cassiicola Philippines TaxID=1448308 RepID=A0A2T2N322_CORCC|nr:hypothetical protein BS50DRAFT_507487 [Corynespora cassiicola Philippines]
MPGLTSADLSAYTSSVFIPFIHQFGTRGVPLVKASIHGSDFDLPVDTGSTGLLIGAPLLPDVDPSEGTPAYEYLTSSNILYNGRLVHVAITFHASTEWCTTAKVPVLVVDKSWVCPWYNPKKDAFDCPPSRDGRLPTPRDTSKISYMGVGFGRNKPGDGQPAGVPRGNPFLNIASVNGEAVPPGLLRTGYMVSTEGIQLGLTAANTRGFVWIDLEPGVTHDEDPRDWAMVNMSFSIDGKAKNHGPALIDTGIPQMYIRAAEGVSIPNITIRNPNPKGMAKFVRRIQPGTKITVGFPALDASMVAGYSFQAGEGSQMEPSHVVPEREGSPPFINTGRNFLFGYQVAFDADGGRFGFRASPIKHPSSSSD